jgi:hypothetical protein
MIITCMAHRNERIHSRDHLFCGHFLLLGSAERGRPGKCSRNSLGIEAERSTDHVAEGATHFLAPEERGWRFRLHCPKQLVGDQLFTGSGRACGSKK